MPHPTHYTEEPSRLSLARSATFIRVHGSGFVTRDMLDATVEELRTGSREVRLAALLVDLRMMAGYETACLLAVRQFLREAPTLGVHRIAVVATSSVLRTASRLTAHTVAVDLRTFEQERSALQWLQPAAAVSHGNGPHASGAAVVTPRSHASSSPAALPS